MKKRPRTTKADKITAAISILWGMSEKDVRDAAERFYGIKGRGLSKKDLAQKIAEKFAEK